MSDGASPVLTRIDMSTQDPDVAHETLGAASARTDVSDGSDAARFTFAQEGVSTPSFSLTRIRYSTAVELDIAHADDRLLVGLPVSGQLGLGADGDRVRLGLGEPGLMPDRPDWWVALRSVTADLVTLDRAAVVRQARDLGLEMETVSFSTILPRSLTAASYWRSTVEHLRTDLLVRDDVAVGGLAIAAATRTLALAVLTTFPNTAFAEFDRGPGPAGAEPAALRRALAYIDAHAGEDIGPDDIAEAARLSVRGLQMLFRRHRGSTPMGYLRDVRLGHAHHALKEGDPTRGDTVAAIAARWGFTHPGRFSVAYRRVHGCSPMETLRR